MPSGRLKGKFDFSPSVHHKLLMLELKPRLAYGGGLKAWRRRLRDRLMKLLGETPKRKCPLNARSLWKRKHKLGSIEKIVFTSEPGCDVPAYFCLPKGAPLATFVCLQGHSTGMHNSIAVAREDERRPIKVEGDRDFAIGCMERGVAALCVEQRSMGERRELAQERRSADMCHDAAMQALMLGRTLVGERLYDIDRALDYLESRGDVDMSRIGVLGNSGGGTMSVYAAALLPRIAFAMPSCSFGSFRLSKMALHHCACGYVPGIMLYAEMGDVLGLAAPKPLVVVAGREDPVVPLKSVREGFAQVKRIYAAAGAEARCHLVIGDEGHRFYADAAWRVMAKELERC